MIIFDFVLMDSDITQVPPAPADLAREITVNVNVDMVSNNWLMLRTYVDFEMFEWYLLLQGPVVELHWTVKTMPYDDLD